MALYTLDAIEITSDDGTGSVVSYTDSATGFTSGIFRAATGRQTVSSASGDSSSTAWVFGLLGSDGVSGSVSADFESTPKLTRASGFSFQVINVSDFIGTVKAAGIDLINRTVKHYHARSTNGTTWVFYLRQTGIIESIKVSETTVDFDCSSSPKMLTSKIPKTKIDKTRFPNANDSDLGDPVPLVLGRVKNAPLKIVRTASNNTPLCTVSGVDYDAAPCLTYTPGSANYTLRIKTGDKIFTDNSYLLVGKYLRIISGGVTQSRYITGVTSVPASNATDIIFEEPLDTSTAFLGWTALNTTDDVWYCTVAEFTATAILSELPVYSMDSNDSGAPKIYQYSKETNNYTNVSEISDDYSTTAIESTGLPGVKVVSAGGTPEGYADTYHPLAPSGASVSYDSIGFFAGSEAALTSVDRSDGIFWTFNGPGLFYIDIDKPDISALGDIRALSVLFDLNHSRTAPTTIQLDVAIKLIDVFDRVIDTAITKQVFGPIIYTTSSNYHLLPNKYYPDGTGSNDLFYANVADLDIYDFVSNKEKSSMYKSVRIEISYGEVVVAGNNTLTVKEVGYIATVRTDYAGEPLHINTVGAMFGTTWNSRRTSADPVLLAGDIVEKLIRDVEAQPDAIDENAFDDIRGTFRWWAFAGRAITKLENTLDVIEDIGKDFFIGFRMTRTGLLSPISFLDQSTILAAFDSSNTWDVIEAVENTSQAKVYTEIDLKYNYDPGIGKHTARLFVANTDQSAFPSDTALVDSGTTLTGWTILKVISGLSIFYEITFSSAHNLEAGQYLTLVGNSGGYDFGPAQASVASATVVNVAGSSLPSGASTSGTLSLLTDTTLQWQTYVGGIGNYSAAKTLWDAFRANYVTLRRKNAAPESVNNCDWIIDETTMVNGNYIWSDIASSSISPIYEYASRIASWASVLKNVISFNVEKTAANLALNVYDLVSYENAALTNGAESGYIAKIDDVPSSGVMAREHLRITMMFIPTYTVDMPDRIIDTAGDADRILDTADAADRILDTPS